MFDTAAQPEFAGNARTDVFLFGVGEAEWNEFEVGPHDGERRVPVRAVWPRTSSLKVCRERPVSGLVADRKDPALPPLLWAARPARRAVRAQRPAVRRQVLRVRRTGRALPALR